MIKRIVTIILYFILYSMSSRAEINEPIEFNGYIASYHSVRRSTPYDYMSSHTCFRGEISKVFKSSSFFVSFNINHNNRLPKKGGIQLKEAFIDYNKKNWSLKIGRQLIIWGNADGLRICDQISPMDMTEFLARDYDEIRIPVEALKIKYFRQNIKLECIYIPIFKSYILPLDPQNPWTIAFFNKHITHLNNKPKPLFKNGEIGSKLSFNLPGIDFSFSSLYSYNKMPLFIKQNNSIILESQYKRILFVGCDFSIPMQQCVIRSESAFTFNKGFENQTHSCINKHHSINALIGLDWYAPNEWMLSTQITNECILNYSNEIKQKNNTTLVTINISKKLFTSTLKLQTFLYTDLTNKGLFNRTSCDYSLSDQIHLLIGYDYFEGKKGIFANYKNNSEIWIKAKYNF